jgi:hypothetical protein
LTFWRHLGSRKKLSMSVVRGIVSSYWIWMLTRWVPIQGEYVADPKHYFLR